MTLRKKLLITITCLSVILCTLVIGTVAWLTSETESIKIEFKPSDIEISLSEKQNTLENGEVETENTTMIPGKAMPKTVGVTVKKDSEKCYLFIKLEESLGQWAEVDGEQKVFSDYFLYAVANGWLPLVDENKDGVADDGVYYQVVETPREDTTFYVFGAEKVEAVDGQTADPRWNDNQIYVRPEVTREMLSALNAEGAVKPSLTVTAYAIQHHGFDDAQAAWAELKPAEQVIEPTGTEAPETAE